ncbi:MAG: nuclear transport factor 2 family protein [Verrucomicrobiota bacterium]
MKKPMLAAISLTLILCGGILSAEDDELLEKLVAEENTIYEALKNKDEETLAKMLEKQKLAVLPGLGRLPLPEVLALQPEVESFSVSDAKLFRVNDDCVILSYRYTWSGSRSGDEVTEHVSFATSVWSKFDGKWRAVFYQATPE